MENNNETPASNPGQRNDFSITSNTITETPDQFIYPAKPELEESKSKINVWLRSLSSLALYFIIGYFFFNKDWLLVLVLTGVVVFHEMGHFLAMKLYNYTELGIFFIPLLGAYASGTKHEISQKQSAIIILAGPIPGIMAGIIVYFFAIHHNNIFLERISWILVFLNLLNLFPVYPLDGGQLLNRLFLDESAIIGKIFIIISSLALAWFFYEIHFYPLLLFPIMMLGRMFTDIKHDRLIKKIEAEGVDLNTSYEDITDEQYWKIRNALIKHHTELQDVAPAPPYEYADKEDKIITTMQGLLQRTIIMDLSVAGKTLIIFIWLACFAAPVLMDMPIRLF
jgi:stage IV sporulation protein FB